MEANIEEEKEDDDKDDDDDDGVIVEKASPWSCQPVFEDKYHRDTDAAADIYDEDDDIEGLLAPQNDSLQDQYVFSNVILFYVKQHSLHLFWVFNYMTLLFLIQAR